MRCNCCNADLGEGPREFSICDECARLGCGPLPSGDPGDWSRHPDCPLKKRLAAGATSGATFHRPCIHCGVGIDFENDADDAAECPGCGGELYPVAHRKTGVTITASELPGRGIAERLAAMQAGHETVFCALLDEPQEPEPNWKKPSRAVCASDGDNGWILFYVGPHIEMEVENYGTRELEQLGLGDAPAGVSVWEGTTKGGERISTQEGVDYNDTYLAGKFRPPTDEEWTAIREGRCPWDPKEWLLDVAPGSSPQTQLEMLTDELGKDGAGE